jgi:DNA-binding transcriptional MerR regulator
MVRNQMTIADAAHELRVGPWTLRRLESLGHIPTPRRDALSRRRVYTEDDLQQIREALSRLADERALAQTA